MAISKGGSWGISSPLPADGLVVESDAEARAAIEDARRERRPVPVLGLLGGDLCRTLGGTGDRGRLESPDAMTFTVDLGEALLDGRVGLFVAHLVARSRLWRRAFVAMNAQWYRHWDLGPRSHPGDGLLDTYDARVPLSELWKVRSRLGLGTHLPYPGIIERRASSVQVELERPLPVEADGVPVGTARLLVVRVEPDALTVVV